MAKKSILTETDNMTVEVKKDEKKYEGPTAQLFLREMENSGEEGVPVDQYEHVTISNETGVEKWLVKRGEWVEVPATVYIALKEKYGKQI